MLTRPISRLLALHPNVQERLRTECTSLPSCQVGDVPSKEELKNMTYLQNVIHEGAYAPNFHSSSAHSETYTHIHPQFFACTPLFP